MEQTQTIDRYAMPAPDAAQYENQLAAGRLQDQVEAAIVSGLERTLHSSKYSTVKAQVYGDELVAVKSPVKQREADCLTALRGVYGVAQIVDYNPSTREMRTKYFDGIGLDVLLSAARQEEGSENSQNSPWKYDIPTETVYYTGTPVATRNEVVGGVKGILKAVHPKGYAGLDIIGRNVMVGRDGEVFLPDMGLHYKKGTINDPVKDNEVFDASVNMDLNDAELLLAPYYISKHSGSKAVLSDFVDMGYLGIEDAGLYPKDQQPELVH